MRSRCRQVNINNNPIPVKTEVKYFGLHLDEKLTKSHIKEKRRQLDLKIKNKYKNRTSVHENQLIKDLFNQTIEERRLKRIWPEDLLDEV
jgi:hypothetical protein